MPKKYNNSTLKNIVTTFNKKGEINKSSSNSSMLPKILSVCAAILLWLYVFQAVEYETKVKNIPITLVNFNSTLGFDVVSGYESTLDLTLTGTKSVINSISDKDIKATADMSGVSEKGTHTINVTVDVPGNAKISNQSVSQIQVTVDKTVEKEIKVVPSVNYNIQHPYELGETTLSAKKVVVKGPESDVNSISHAVVNINLGNVSNDIISNTEIKLVDRNDYEIDSKHIHIKPSYVELKIPVFKTALVDILPDISIDNSVFEYEFHPSRVYIYGSVKDVETLSYLSTKNFKAEKEGEFKVELDVPSNVSAYMTYNSSKDSEIEKITVTVKKVPVQITENEPEEN